MKTNRDALVAIWKLDELRFAFRVDGAALECVAHGVEPRRSAMAGALARLRAAGFDVSASAAHISFR